MTTLVDIGNSDHFGDEPCQALIALKMITKVIITKKKYIKMHRITKHNPTWLVHL